MTKKNVQKEEAVDMNTVPVTDGKITVAEDQTFSPVLTKKEVNTIVMSLRHTRDFHKKQIEKLEHSIFADIAKIKDQEMAEEYQHELNKHREDHRAAISAYKKMKMELDKVYGNSRERDDY